MLRSLNKTTEELEQISKTFAEYVKSVENEVKTLTAQRDGITEAFKLFTEIVAKDNPVLAGVGLMMVTQHMQDKLNKDKKGEEKKQK